MTENTATVSLTASQIRCLFVGPWALGYSVADETLEITPDTDGWLYVECPKYQDEGGCGVMVDPDGIVYYSAMPRTNPGTDPWKVEILSDTPCDNIVEGNEIILRVSKR